VLSFYIIILTVPIKRFTFGSFELKDDSSIQCARNYSGLLYKGSD